MKFVEQKLVPYRVKAMCDCGSELRFVRKTGEDNNRMFYHSCYDCYSNADLDCEYPKIEYRIAVKRKE